MNSGAMIRFFKFGQGALAFVLVAALLLWPVRVNACACCSEEGTWAEWTEPFDASELEELARLKFAEVANAYANAEGEVGEQIAGNFSGEFSISLTKRQARRWDLRFRDQQGRTGTLTLTVPNTLTEFQVDPQDGQKSAGGGPLLYKEWRLTGTVAATGIFRRGNTQQTRYRLILQGRGNACTSADMFESWTLQIFGPRASYSFYGKFKKLA
jgi:hypothetical protein